MAPLRVWVLEVDADASGVRVVAGDYEDSTLGSVMGSQLFLDAALRLRYAPAKRNTRALSLPVLVARALGAEVL